MPKGYHALPGGKAGALGLRVGKELRPRSWPVAIIPSWPESRPRVTVHAPRANSVQRTIVLRMGRGRGFALEWPKVGGRGRRAARAIQVGISGTDFKGNSRHNSGEGDRAQIDNNVRRYGQQIRDAEARRRASEREPN